LAWQASSIQISSADNRADLAGERRLDGVVFGGMTLVHD
jgi:hypothetical protein